MPVNKNRRYLKLDWAIYLNELESKVLGGANKQATELGHSHPPCEELHFQSLLAKSHHRHWAIREQAARELAKVNHPSTCEVLIHLLKDERCSVSWAAANSLINHRRYAVRPLLEELTRDFQSRCFLQAAHHVLSELHQLGELSSQEIRVLHSINHFKRGLMIAQTANEALIAGQLSTG